MADKRLYIGGAPNPDTLGFIPLRYSAGDGPNARELERAAAALGEPIRATDSSGYECELIAAAVNDAGSIVYVRSRCKEREGVVDIEFRVHLFTADGDASWPIETYNPYFGCDVRLIDWIGDVAIVIYREKHHTYVCRAGRRDAAAFARIEDDWVIGPDVVAYWEWNATRVSRMRLSDFHELEALSEEEARVLNLLPPKGW